MTSHPLQPIERPELATIHPARPYRGSMVAVVTALIAVLILNPVGYIGGGQDDARYLAAARCWVANGMCLPQNHWEGRWPVFAPMALAIKVFGESRASVQLWALLSSGIAILLFVNFGKRLFGQRAGVIAGPLLIVTPAFALQILMPSVESVELCFVLGGGICMLVWRDRPSGGWSLAAGLCFGLAFQVRETSIAAAALAVVAMFAFGMRPKPVHLALAAIGFAIPLAIEFATFQHAIGDPFYRRRLSLLHGRIPSSELAASVDRSRSPILNPDFIANWRREPGLHVYWLIDGPLNLLLNVKAGFSLWLTPLLLAVGRNRLTLETRRAAWWLLSFAAAYICLITYVFAMDPKPRVMLIALAASSLSFALVAGELLRRGVRALAIACLAAAAAGGAISIAGYGRPIWAERQAQAWDSAYPGQIEADLMTKSMLTFSPETRAMPDLIADRPYVMIISNGNCSDWVSRGQFRVGLLSLVDEKRLTIVPGITKSWAWICLFRYDRPVSASQMNEAIIRAWNNEGLGAID
jgi:hypothetical protein